MGSSSQAVKEDGKNAHTLAKQDDVTTVLYDKKQLDERLGAQRATNKRAIERLHYIIVQTFDVPVTPREHLDNDNSWDVMSTVRMAD